MFHSKSQCQSESGLLLILFVLAFVGIRGDYDWYGDYSGSELDYIFADASYDAVCPPGGYPVCATNGYTYHPFASKCRLDSHNLKQLFAGKKELTRTDLDYCQSYSIPAQQYYPKSSPVQSFGPVRYSASSAKNSYAYAAASGPYGAKASAEAPGPYPVAPPSHDVSFSSALTLSQGRREDYLGFLRADGPKNIPRYNHRPCGPRVCGKSGLCYRSFESICELNEYNLKMIFSGQDGYYYNTNHRSFLLGQPPPSPYSPPVPQPSISLNPDYYRRYDIVSTPDDYSPALDYVLPYPEWSFKRPQTPPTRPPTKSSTITIRNADGRLQELDLAAMADANCEEVTNVLITTGSRIVFQFTGCIVAYTSNSSTTVATTTTSTSTTETPHEIPYYQWFGQSTGHESHFIYTY
ncbi:hypothetical protein M5D96_013908 [Drosophila gunungcola]|uniref:Uncharacterized protein n=1 Tax=Drosophila gunungcola TaxID=103775 RepID=A0A9P9YAE1_9MUSC|nr:hypothetical protein M5D96_013908 [Drosophila gunungcola]